MAGETDKIAFRLIKSNLFRVISADGIFGGLTPRGNLFMSFFSERLPIPERIVHLLTPEGKVGEEVLAERESKDGVIREVEVGVAVDLDTAKALVVWLQDKIKQAEKLRVETKKEDGTIQ
jgi:predicted polyphosphate/ATP-dependent NAD kinase